MTTVASTTRTTTAIDGISSAMSKTGNGSTGKNNFASYSSPEIVFTRVDNFIDNRFVPPASKTCGSTSPPDRPYMEIRSPSRSDAVVGEVALSSAVDVDLAVGAGLRAFPAWADLTARARTAHLYRFFALLQAHAGELAELIVLENGKNVVEARADVAKGMETLEYALSLPHSKLLAGHTQRVSTRVSCRDRRDPLGVVACVVPFNFPFMVPMWTVPIALACGNVVVIKPSEKVPLTLQRTAELAVEAGLPPGVFNLINGQREAVEALIDHKDVRAVTFVGSSPVAAAVYDRCHTLGKKCTALGGAKNHLVALPDCDVEQAASDIVVSFAGCAGQRCMAASVLLLPGGHDTLLEKVVTKASELRAGTGPGCMGHVIDEASRRKIEGYLEGADADPDTKILLDGRLARKDNGDGGVHDDRWIGPTVVLHTNPNVPAMREEIFGPVLSVYAPSSWEEAVRIENSNPFGNAAAVYTVNGGSADWFCRRFRAAMLGVNVGIPVPREPFGFGGLYGTQSKHGDGADITGDAAVEFFTNRIKITEQWPEATQGIKLDTGGTDGAKDDAHFSGRM